MQDQPPEDMTPHERFIEIAAILARGALRLPAATPEEPPLSSSSGSSPQNCLDLPAHPSPHAQGG